MSTDVLTGFEKSTFTHDGKTRDVFRLGSGPAVIVIAEVPGITPKVVEFARRVADIGCTAVLPHLFGVPGKDPFMGGRIPNMPYTMSTIGPACISREFTVWATGKTSQVIDWLRALARSLHEECGGPGVGAVGMCFTGNFALAMMVDAPVVAPVLSQPSLPFAVTGAQKRDLAISDDDLEAVKDVCAARDLTVLGLRFTSDRIVPKERFARLREELGDHFVGVEIDSSRGNPWGHPRSAHAVLTENLIDEPGQPTREALEQVLGLFRSKLLADSGSGERAAER